MIHFLNAKGLVSGLLLTICAFSASAQKIDEQQLKTNVSEIKNAVQYLETLKPVTFKYDTSKFRELKLSSNIQHGFLAQEFSLQHPELVFEAFKTFPAGKGNTKTIRYDEVSKEDLIPVLVAAIKEQQAQIEELKQQLNQLTTK
jgi:hypothetical protein